MGEVECIPHTARTSLTYVDDQPDWTGRDALHVPNQSACQVVTPSTHSLSPSLLSLALPLLIYFLRFPPSPLLSTHFHTICHNSYYHL